MLGARAGSERQASTEVARPIKETHSPKKCKPYPLLECGENRRFGFFAFRRRGLQPSMIGLHAEKNEKSKAAILAALQKRTINQTALFFPRTAGVRFHPSRRRNRPTPARNTEVSRPSVKRQLMTNIIPAA